MFHVASEIIDEIHNTRIYNLNSVPKISRFLLADAIISNKTNPCSDSKKQKRDNDQN